MHVRGNLTWEIDKDGVGRHLEGRKWSICNDKIQQSMEDDHPLSMVPILAALLPHYRVLLYNGESDLNW